MDQELTLPKEIAQNWVRGKTDLQLFIREIASPSHRQYYALDHQYEFISEMATGKYEEGWFSGGNSAGKTWTGKWMALHWGVWKIKPGKPWTNYDEFFNAPYNILCTGPENKSAVELWEKVEEAFRTSPILRTQVAEIRTSTRLKSHPYIKLKNGTIIEAIGLHDKGKHIEGEAYDLILINEPADIRSLKHVMEKVLIPRTWRRGGIICGFGTPKGKGEYWEVVKRGVPPEHPIMGGRNPNYDSNVITFFADSRSNPFAAQDKIAKTLDSGNSALITERILGQFVDESTLAFPTSQIEESINEQLSLPIKPNSGHFYITGVDFGRKVDYTVAITLDITAGMPPYTVTNFYRKGGGTATWSEILGDLLVIHNEYYGEFVVDSTASAGDMQMEWLDDMGLSYIPYQFAGSPAKKANLITNLQMKIGNKELIMPYIEQLIDELKSYPKNMDDTGMETDCVMALGLAMYGAYEYGPLGEVESIHR